MTVVEEDRQRGEGRGEERSVVRSASKCYYVGEVGVDVVVEDLGWIFRSRVGNVEGSVGEVCRKVRRAPLDRLVFTAGAPLFKLKA